MAREFNGKKIYAEDISASIEYKKTYLTSIENFIKKKMTEAENVRDEYISPEKLFADPEKFKKDYSQMLGILSSDGLGVPKVRRDFCGSDDFGVIYRVSLEVMEDFWFYATLTIPHGTTKAPLIIAQHGGGGTPELCNDFIGENNYTYFTKYALEQKMVVFSPQLLLWNFEKNVGECFPGYPSLEFNRDKTDRKLQRLGTSITGLEIFCIKRCIDWLETLDFVDESKIGMMGLSYGGFFSLYTTAAEPRIKATYAAGFFNDRANVVLSDWNWKNSSYTFHDAEVCGLCAPRMLILDVGREDIVFDYKYSMREAKRAARYYDYIGKSENFIFNLWDGGHKFDVQSGNFEKFFDAVIK